MSRKRNITFLVTLTAVITAGYILFRPAFSYLTGYLSKSEVVDANIIIIEGWMPDSSIKMAYDEIKADKYDLIVTTGMISFEKYFKVYSNGFLIFRLKGLLSEVPENINHTIDIEAYSEMGGKNRAHFNLYINDSLAADFLTSKRSKTYSINWKGDLKDIDSIMIEFDNDRFSKHVDRNLRVRNICFDKKITIPYLDHSEYDILDLDGKSRIINKQISNAELARNQLIAYGIDSSRIISVTAKKVMINRTLTSALAFRDWLYRGNRDIKGINIISLGPHARRTWMTYNKILDEKFRIGIISLPEPATGKLSKNKSLRTLREALGIVYYWIILLPY